MLELILALGSLLTGLLVPIGLGLGLAAGQADAAGQDQHMGGDGVPFPVVCQLHPVKEFCQAFVLAGIEQLSRHTHKGLIFG